MSTDQYDDISDYQGGDIQDEDEFEYAHDEMGDVYNNDNLTVSSINSKREHEEERMVQNYMSKKNIDKHQEI